MMKGGFILFRSRLFMSSGSTILVLYFAPHLSASLNQLILRELGHTTTIPSISPSLTKSAYSAKTMAVFPNPCSSKCKKPFRRFDSSSALICTAWGLPFRNQLRSSAFIHRRVLTTEVGPQLPIHVALHGKDFFFPVREHPN